MATTEKKKKDLSAKFNFHAIHIWNFEFYGPRLEKNWIFGQNCGAKTNNPLGDKYFTVLLPNLELQC